MARTGPQYYPGANTSSAWYEDNYPGDAMEVNVCVLHTTEGRTLPSYGGGGSAPNLTAVPDFANRRLKWYQHFRIDTSSRALVNLAGGVETNTNNVVQVELVGTCSPSTHADWGSAQHIYWPDAPDWALEGVADFLRWVNAQHGVPLVGPKLWNPYPKSYGSAGGQRFTNAEWNAFRGICGHQHVAENSHGDPGALDFARLLAMAKGEDDVALDAADKTWITNTLKSLLFDETIGKDAVNAPVENESNPTWQAASYLRNTYNDIQAIKVDLAAVLAQARANGAALTSLAAALASLDTDEIAALVAALPDQVAAKLANLEFVLKQGDGA